MIDTCLRNKEVLILFGHVRSFFLSNFGDCVCVCVCVCLCVRGCACKTLMKEECSSFLILLLSHVKKWLTNVCVYSKAECVNVTLKLRERQKTRISKGRKGVFLA